MGLFKRKQKQVEVDPMGDLLEQLHEAGRLQELVRQVYRLNGSMNLAQLVDHFRLPLPVMTAIVNYVEDYKRRWPEKSAEAAGFAVSPARVGNQLNSELIVSPGDKRHIRN